MEAKCRICEFSAYAEDSSQHGKAVFYDVLADHVKREQHEVAISDWKDHEVVIPVFDPPRQTRPRRERR